MKLSDDAAPSTYRAGIATIRRTSDGMLSTMWGLHDGEGKPVTTDQLGPWTRTDQHGGVWEHVGKGVADSNAFLLFDFLDDVFAWLAARPQPCVLSAEGLRWEFDGGAGSASRSRRP